MKIAIVGCAHGELEKIYESVQHLETTENVRIDLLICCGDFQAVRNHDDLNCMAVPMAYRTLNTFYKYYSGRSKSPYLTLFVGGNHEASNYLAELPYGGWVAPGIYYLGYANVLRVGQLRIGGLSGIFGKSYDNDHMKGHFECPPYNESTLRSAYHARQVDAFRLKQLKSNGLDIFISHDWPRGIHQFGDTAQLFREKPFFRDDAQSDRLGNPLLRDLLFALKPRYWFAAHLHVKFPALVDHEDGSRTRFLALDKCLPHRKFLQILDIGESTTTRVTASDFRYDPEWLTILRSTSHLTSTSNRVHYMPGPCPGSDTRYDFTPTEDELTETQARFDDDFEIPQNFRWTAPPLLEEESTQGRNRQAFRKDVYGRPEIRQKFYVNPQTTEFCEKVGVTNLNSLLARLRPQHAEEAYYQKANLQLEREGDEASAVTGIRKVDENPDEIQLDDEKVDAPSSNNVEGVACGEIGASIPTQKRHFEDSSEELFQASNEGGSGTVVGNDAKEEQATSSAVKKFKRRNADLYSNLGDAE